MRRAASPGSLGLVLCLAAGAVALLALAHRQPMSGPGPFAALALAIELARLLALIGLHGRLGAWLLAALAGLLIGLEIERLRRERAAALAAKPAPPRPYGLPARVAVALQAAARARMGGGA